MLIFGCRDKEADYYYNQEWQELQTQGVTLKVITAFSRENPDEGKVYVQHKIRENGAFLAELILKSGAYIYVSGRAKFMPKSVEKAFAEIITQQAEAEGDGALIGADYIAQMKKTGKYQQEVW